MQRYLFPLYCIAGFLLVGQVILPLAADHTAELKASLVHLKHYCRTHAWTGYLIYTGLLSFILLTGLPVATGAIVLAGVIYGFWEAATLVTFCRLAVAWAMFCLVRQMEHVMEDDDKGGDTTALPEAPLLLRKFEHHPNIGLLLARLAPIPDSVVNYAVAAAPIRRRDYMVVSMVGMIPFTLLCVWMGERLGTINGLMRYLY